MMDRPDWLLINNIIYLAFDILSSMRFERFKVIFTRFPVRWKPLALSLGTKMYRMITLIVHAHIEIVIASHVDAATRIWQFTITRLKILFLVALSNIVITQGRSRILNTSRTRRIWVKVVNLNQFANFKWIKFFVKTQLLLTHHICC